MSVTDMRKALREAALLRNLIETCLKAAPSPMGGRELADWPSISQQTGGGKRGYDKTLAQVRNLIKEGKVEKFGGGTSTEYSWNRKFVAQAADASLPPGLHIQFSKSKQSLRFTLGGVSITVEVTE